MNSPIQTFVYSEILKTFTFSVAQQLTHFYQSMNGTAHDLMDPEAPVCDLNLSNEDGPDKVSIDNNAVAALFIYHFLSFGELPELNEQEEAWLTPVFVARLKGENPVYQLSFEQVKYILWLYENKRVSLDWALRLVHTFALEYNEYQQNSLLQIMNVDQLMQIWQESFIQCIEESKDAASARLSKQEEKVCQQHQEREQEQKELEDAILWLRYYEQNKKAADTKLAQAAEAPTARYRKLRCLLDQDGILWVNGTGKFRRELIVQLSEQGLDSYKAVYVGEGITDIEVGTFYEWNQYHLRAVHLPETLRNIKKCAFQDCKKLAYIMLPPNVRYIGEKAFGGCKDLNSLTLPAGLEYLHSKAFAESGLICQPEIPEGCGVIGRMQVLSDGEALFYIPEE